MAQRQVIEWLDDLDAGRADETVRFSLDGTDYEIDLSADNARSLRTALAPYLSAARRTGSARPMPSGGESTADAHHSQEIRQWARARGFEVSNRGRIPAYLREAYRRR